LGERGQRGEQEGEEKGEAGVHGEEVGDERTGGGERQTMGLAENVS
jgi:hypothetical protein